MEEIIVIAGATATGKTKLAIELAKEFDGEIVSADSMQIYRGMDIGTAKPTKEEQEEVRHHMIDVADVTDAFSTMDFVRGADEAICDICARGKMPIVAGGTGMYLDCLTGRMTLDAPASDENVRRDLTEMLEREGKDALYELFLQKCPEMKEKIHKNDTKRVMRAIEKALSPESTSKFEEKKRYKSLWFSIDIERKTLYNKIDERVDEMMRMGLEDEVRRVILPVREKCTTSLQGIGYKEMLMYIDGAITLEEAAELIKKRSRNYAKRQLTWFRRNESINCLDAQSAFETAKDIILKERER